MIQEIQTAFGILKLVPEAIQVGKDIWGKLKPPKQLETSYENDGISGQTYFSGNFNFAISIPSAEWEFWRPTSQFLAAMGATFTMPTRSLPIIILSKHMIKLFRPNVSVTTEVVGQYTNIEEMIQISKLMLQNSDNYVEEKDIHIDMNNQSGAIVSCRSYLNDTLYQVQHCYLRDGIFYTITACYVPMSSYSKQLFGGLQEIMSSFKFIEA